MRTTTTFAALCAVLFLANCTKEQVFSNPDTGTVLELGFDWNDPVSFCIDSDDHPEPFCGTAQWLDGERLQIDLPTDGVSWVEDTMGSPKKKKKSEVVLYVYNPAMHTVTLYLTGGQVVLRWREGRGCFEGDLLHEDVLTICH